MRRTGWTALKVSLAASLACALSAPVAAAPLHADAPPPKDAAQYEVLTVAEGFAFPWSLAFLPSGDLLVAERNGGLKRIPAGGGKLVSIAGLPDDVFARGQGGLFDVLLAPDFESTGVFYLAYAQGERRANTTRVAKAQLRGDTIATFEVIFTSAPAKDTPAHFGGRMAFLPDGSLLLTLGDGFVYREKAQSLSDHLGTIVRIGTDGSVPEDNPFVGTEGALPEIYSYGHRNVQGILVEPGTGRIYSHEHGARGGDELNLIEPGVNYGWPAITYGIDYSGAIISPYTEREGMAQPLLHWTPSIAPSGMALYSGSAFPDWEGDILVSALAGARVERVDMENGVPVGRTALFDELGERIRDVRVGPDGSLYLLTDDSDGQVFRVVPATP